MEDEEVIMTKDQIEWGYEKLQEYCDKVGITMDQAVRVLENTKAYKEFWNWVNADEFLISYPNHKVDV